MVWPPIPFSYDTASTRSAVPAPRRRPRDWLGTDDQARDVVARLLYGFRISVLFGLVLTALSTVIGVAAGAVQGYFGGWVDLAFQRLLEIWSGRARALPADHPVERRAAQLLAGCWDCCCCSAGPGRSGWCAPSSCAPATSNMSAPPARSASATRPSCAPRAAQCGGLHPHLPAVHAGWRGHHADLARLPGLRPAARLAPRSANCSTRARPTCRRRGSALPASSCWRSC